MPSRFIFATVRRWIVSTPRFLADEDPRFSIVAATRRREPTVDFLTIAEIGKSGASDPEVLEFAQSQSRIIISHDRIVYLPL